MQDDDDISYDLQTLEEIEKSLHLTGLKELYNTRAAGDIAQGHDSSFRLTFKPTKELCTVWEKKAEYEAQGLFGWPQEEREGFHLQIVDNAGLDVAALTFLEKTPGAFYVAGTSTPSNLVTRVLPLSERSPEVQTVLIAMNESRSKSPVGPIPGFPI